MAQLITLASIRPAAARQAERKARAKFANRTLALQAAQYELVVAPGCHSSAYPPSIGWCVSRTAADAYAAEVTHMPGGTSHRRRAVVDHTA